MDIRKLPIGIQSFRDLRQNKYLYVDKTAYIYSLAQNGKTYFLSRPRRFGKSLLLSTMDAYFSGQKELFTGLAVERLEAGQEHPWTVYPVLHFDFTGENYTVAGALENRLDRILNGMEAVYGTTDGDKTLAARFISLIRNAYRKTGRGVVVLVDEYDKPLLESMDNEKLQQSNQALFKGFFGALKGQDQYLHFVFFTGVTKFSRVSIFSDLNQLNDISMDRNYAAVCGITQEELEADFVPEIHNLAEDMRMTYKECIAELGRMYDGYHFCENSEGIYNPFSVLNAFAGGKFDTYWFATGTPTFLVNELQKNDYDVRDFTESVEATAQILSDYRLENRDPVPLFYQSGYLTITGYDRELGIYSLGYPNAEVKYGFLNFLAPSYTNLPETKQTLYIGQFIRDIRTGKVDGVMERFKAIYAGLPYGNNVHLLERDFQIVVYLIFTLLGQYTKTEVHSAKGRADCIVETKDTVYIFEFKVDSPAEAARAQTDAQGYAAPYAADSRRIVKTGVSFSSTERNITDWVTE